MKNKTKSPLIFMSIIVAMIFGFAIGVYWSAGLDSRTRIVRGQELATLACSRCHNLSHRGESPNAAAPPFRTLVKRLSQEGLQEQLEVALSLGHAPMPPWNISPTQSDELLMFILSIGQSTKS